MPSTRLSTNTENKISAISGQLAVKRLCDFFCSVIFLILLSPVFAVIALAIVLDSPGKPIFKQTRVGRDGVPFTIYKFRTMVNNADTMRKKIEKDHLNQLVYQDKNDFRVTRVGKFLRRTSLDELPQLLNIANGTMSLIGPRPEVPDVVEHYTVEQRRRLLMSPGITGLAQVNGRGDLSLEETIQYDLAYIETYSLLLDLKILLKTFKVVFTGQGAY